MTTLRTNMKHRAALIALAFIPGLALAHVGADAGAHHGLLAGLLHPLTGTDHLLAMLAVGLWSALTARGRADAVRAPVVFATVLLAGAVAAALGLQLPGIEPMIATSVLVLGLLVASGLRLPAWAGALLVGAFAFFHGAAHGQELGGAAALAGMVLATGALHAAGIAAGWLLKSRGLWLARSLGLAAAAYGVLLLAA